MFATKGYVSGDEYEEADGRLARRYTRSRFLDYVAAATFATAEYPGRFTHWGVICGNHIIDVASLEEPAVREISSGA